MKLKVSNQFNPKIIKNLYRNEKDLKLAYPTASFPINIDEWNSWMSKGESKNFSLTWFRDEAPISHIAIMSYIVDPGLVYLCFFIIDDEFRGKKLAKEILESVYSFVRKELRKNELWLVVDSKNNKAFNLYKREGFEIIDNRPAGIRMRKKL
ncbi:GNAT family N-acetyltransferase [Halobacteriovorax sp.]|uniref:GNAT family N-acetyltransferase n=1 Tax=Halobacteriovorax sp. TaxID=2020862 RepID=UPI0035639BB1